MALCFQEVVKAKAPVDICTLLEAFKFLRAMILWQ